MKFLEKVRYHAFWLTDAIKGGKLRTHYHRILANYEQYGSKESIESRKKNLDTILSHAINTVPYYKKYNGYSSIEDFPVIDKNTFKAHFNDFYSDAYLGKKMIKVSTSGSTGVPFSLYQNKDKKLRNTADTLFFAKLANYEVGNKLIYFRDWDGNAKGKLAAFMQNLVLINSNDLQEDIIKDFLLHLKNDHTSRINMIGYPSAFEIVCDYLDKNQPSLKIDNVISIITIAETLDSKIKSSLKKYFNCPVVSRYSNNELGMLAQQKAGAGEHFYMNTASYFIELLALDKDRHVRNGEIGRIVVTDLFNYCMPVIRYDTGDLGILSEETEAGENPALARIEGRKMDMIYDPNGKLVSPHYFHLLTTYSGLLQYQFIQKNENTYLCKLNVEEVLVAEENKVRMKLMRLLGPEANIKFEYVDEIPLLASGKRKKVLNEFKVTSSK